MQFSVSLYSFYPAIQRGEIAPVDCIAKAKELGFEAVEAVDFVNFGDCATQEERLQRAKELRAAADAAELPFSSLAVAADLLNGSGGDTAKEIQRVKEYVDVAVVLGAPRMRHDITQGYKGDRAKSYDALVPQLAQAVREITQYAQEKGVLTMTENHGFFSQDSQRVEKLYNAVDHPNFALLCDMGNFLCADEDPALAVARVAPYAKYVHAKDFIWKSYKDADPGEGAFRTRAGNFLRGTIVGHGNVPVQQCLHILKAAGFDGAMALEFEGVEDPFTALRIGLCNLRRYWAQA